MLPAGARWQRAGAAGLDLEEASAAAATAAAAAAAAAAAHSGRPLHGRERGRAYALTRASPRRPRNRQRVPVSSGSCRCGCSCSPRLLREPGPMPRRCAANATSPPPSPPTHNDTDRCHRRYNPADNPPPARAPLPPRREHRQRPSTTRTYTGDRRARPGRPRTSTFNSVTPPPCAPADGACRGRAVRHTAHRRCRAMPPPY